jgi:hypothetical protein
MPEAGAVHPIKTIDRFSWPRPINGLFIAKDMTETRSQFRGQSGLIKRSRARAAALSEIA